MDKRQLDELFDDLFEDSIQSEMDVEIPDPDASWNKMSVKIKRQALRHRLRKLIKTSALAVAALFIGAYIFGNPRQTEAFLPVTQFLEDVKEDVVTLFQGDGKKLQQEPKGALTAPPPEGTGPVMGKPSAAYVVGKAVQVKSYEEAGAVTQTPLPTLGHVPAGYELHHIDLYINDTKLLIKGYIYLSKPSSTDMISLHILNVPMEMESAVQLEQSAGMTEKLLVNGMSATFIASQPSERLLIWGGSSIKYVLISGLDRDEMIRIAESIK
jgi:hypothetical protein